MLSTGAQDLNVMTFNIRLNVASDSLNAWPFRVSKVGSQILFHRVHILGVQEALPGQMNDLCGQLTGYRYTGVGRDDGRSKGEFSAIFYDTSRLSLQQSSTFWLSLTPEVPGSKDWDAAITRIVTWGRFTDRKTGNEFFVFNTHFDHIGRVARRESARLILSKVAEIAGSMPVILMGDFNTRPSDEPYQVLTDINNPRRFRDTKKISLAPHYGPEGTFNAFGGSEIDNEPIDHIFIRGNWKVWQHATLSQTWNGRFSSDHFPVFTRVSLE